jgi:TolB-like protein/DNA-binding winged helix-turn-helix (wHTH) protein/Tfp pilus assembly protein PilF
MPTTVRFDCYEVDLKAGQLYKHGLRIGLRDKSFQVLAALLEHPGEVVAREDLCQRLWREEVFVDFENNLNTAIARLREALNDSADHPRFVETVPKRGYRFLGSVSAPPPVPQGVVRRARLVVLPFLNLSGDPTQEYLSEAITDEIITVLACATPEQLAVIARTTAMHYKGSQKDVARIGRELHVDYVVEGGVRGTKDRVFVNVQLIQTSDQAHLFAKRYEAGLPDILHLQNSVAHGIAAHVPGIAGQLVPGLQAAAGRGRKATENLLAYSEYIQARHEMTRVTAEGFTSAKQHLERAVVYDPDFALAYDALAEIYWYLAYAGFMAPRQAASAGIVHAVRAIEIDGSLAEAHALLGEFHKITEYNWNEVEREMALARRLDPNSTLVRIRYALSGLMPHGRLQEAVSELEDALDLDPLSFVGRYWLGIMLLLGRRLEEGIEEGRKLLALDPNNYLGYFVCAIGYRSQNRFEEAVAVQRRAVELSGSSASMLSWLGMTLALNGEATEARDVLRKLHEMAGDQYVPPCCFAWVHLGLREIDTAFEWLNRAVDVHDQLIMPIKSYEFLGPLRSDPRFAELLRRMNLEA